MEVLCVLMECIVSKSCEISQQKCLKYSTRSISFHWQRLQVKPPQRDTSRRRFWALHLPCLSFSETTPMLKSKVQFSRNLRFLFVRSYNVVLTGSICLNISCVERLRTEINDRYSKACFPLPVRPPCSSKFFAWIWLRILFVRRGKVFP